MLVVIPVCHKDVDAALRNLSWARELDGTAPFPCLISCESNFDRRGEVEAAARSYFASVETLAYAPYPRHLNQRWPRPQNWAWRKTALYMVKARQDAWFWWEQDAVPLRAKWLSRLADAYASSGKPFLGARGTTMHSTQAQHLNGVAIYPHNWNQYAPESVLASEALPFDVCGGWRIAEQATFSPLIQHLWSFDNDPSGPPCSFPTREMMRHVSKEAVLFHRCKDSSLISQLSDRPLKEFKPRSLIPKRRMRRRLDHLLIPPQTGSVVPIVAHLDTSSGYGQFSCEVIKELRKRGYRPAVRVVSWNEHGAPLDPGVKASIVGTPNDQPWELVIFPCVIQPANVQMGDRATAYLTMWESTRLTSSCDPARTQAINVMNRCKVVMVPNAWNASVFSACGVDSPIRLVPLGINVEKFPLTPNRSNEDVLVFGTAARIQLGGIRKGFDRVLAAFQTAFPRNEKNVRLRVKCFADDPPLETGGDTRIDQIQKYLTEPELRHWYGSIHVFVSGSAAEGWGRHQQESMCMGRPVIGINFGGVTEFFNEENGFACDWKLEPGEGIYKTMGHYAKPTVESLAAQMRLAFEDRALIQAKAELASESASRFSIANSVDQIVKVLREFKFLK